MLTLQEALLKHFTSHLKSWSLDDDDRGLAALLTRADRLSARLASSNNDEHGRTAAVAAAILSIQGPDLDPRLDPLLNTFLQNIPQEAAHDLTPPLSQALALLPDERRAAHQSTLAGRLAAVMIPLSWRGSHKGHLLFKNLPFAYEAIELETSRSLANQDPYGSNSLSLLRFTLDMDPDTPPQPRLDAALDRMLNSYRRNFYTTQEALDPILRWWPADRLEAALLRQRDQAWEFFPFCPTHPIALCLVKLAKQKINLNAFSNRIENTFVALGPVALPAIINGLNGQLDQGYFLLVAALGRLAEPQHLNTLIQLLNNPGDFVAFTAAEMLAAIDPTLAASALRLHPPEQPWAADLLARLARQLDLPPRPTSTLPLDDTAGPARTRDQWAAWILDRLDDEIVEADPAEALAMAAALNPSHGFTGNWVLSGHYNDPPCRRWRAGLLQGRHFLAFLLDDFTRRNFRSDSWETIWLDTLRFFRRDHRALAFALLALELSANTFPDPAGARSYLDKIAEIFGQTPVLRHGAHFLEHRKARERVELYGWLCDRGAGDEELHLTALGDTSELVRERAARHLIDLHPEGLPPKVSALIKDKKAHVRSGVVTALKLAGRAAALPALRAARAAERSSKVKALIDEAILACDPIAQASVDRSEHFGAYNPDDPLDMSGAMEQLRALVYEKPSLPLWVRLCDLLQRFHGDDALALALDYLKSHKVHEWPAELRQRPWGWSKIEPLAAITVANDKLTWLPVSVLMAGGGDAFIDARLKLLEGGRRARLFQREDVPVFTDAVARAWRWCQTQGIPPENLEVRVDGGSVHASYMMRAESTALELWQGFGATLERGNSRKENEGEEHGLRLVRVTLPSKHPLREELELGRRKKYLEIAPLIGLKTPTTTDPV